MSEHKYSVPDDHWEDGSEEDPEPQAPAVRTGTHFIEIYDERPAVERMGYNGLVWTPVIDEGTITAVAVDHYCPGPMHTDPMGYRAWEAVPPSVKQAMLDALNADDAEAVVDIEATREVADATE
jgi:hypothetical protein